MSLFPRSEMPIAIGHQQVFCCIYSIAFRHLNPSSSKGRSSSFYLMTTNWLNVFSINPRDKSFNSKNLKLTITCSDAPVKEPHVLINEDVQILRLITYSSFVHSQFNSCRESAGNKNFIKPLKINYLILELAHMYR